MSENNQENFEEALKEKSLIKKQKRNYKKNKLEKIEKVDDTQKKLDLLAAKLESLENEISQKDEKLSKLENAQMTLKMGEDEFGTGLWKKLVRGKEKGYIRSIYIDVEAMAGLNKTPHIHS